MTNKFKFPIIKDRVYSLDYDGYIHEVTGEHILAMFRRDAMMDKFIDELSTDDLDKYLDIGEL